MANTTTPYPSLDMSTAQESNGGSEQPLVVNNRLNGHLDQEDQALIDEENQTAAIQFHPSNESYNSSTSRTMSPRVPRKRLVSNQGTIYKEDEHFDQEFEMHLNDDKQPLSNMISPSVVVTPNSPRNRATYLIGNNEIGSPNSSGSSFRHHPPHHHHSSHLHHHPHNKPAQHWTTTVDEDDHNGGDLSLRQRDDGGCSGGGGGGSGVGGVGIGDELSSTELEEPDDKYVRPKKNAKNGVDVSLYTTKKNVAQGMLDIALLSANCSQLKYLLFHYERDSTAIMVASAAASGANTSTRGGGGGGEYSWFSTMDFYFLVNLICIGLSILLQVIVGILLILNGRHNIYVHRYQRVADSYSNLILVTVFVITIVNIFLSVFISAR